MENVPEIVPEMFSRNSITICFYLHTPSGLSRAVRTSYFNDLAGAIFFKRSARSESVLKNPFCVRFLGIIPTSPHEIFLLD